MTFNTMLSNSITAQLISISRLYALYLGLCLSGCASSAIKQQPLTTPQPPVQEQAQAVEPNVPAHPFIHQALTKKFSITGTNLPLKDVLVLMAKDSDIQLDLNPHIQAKISLHVVEQSMQQILDRICKQINLIYRYDAATKTLTVEPDVPVLKHYKIDYVNIDRDTKGGISVTNQLASTQVALKNSASSGANNTQQNNSSTTVNTVSAHHFWPSLIKNLEEILQETDKQILIKRLEYDARLQADFDSEVEPLKLSLSKKNNPEATKLSPDNSNKTEIGSEFADNEKKLKSYRTLFASKIIAHKESGIVSIRATQQQHQKIQEFIDLVQDRSSKQVLIEAAIVEVTLHDEFQSGVDWARLASGGGEQGWAFSQKLTGSNLSSPPYNVITYKQNGALGDITASIKFLQTFGKTKVLSSPKLMVMNNQTAVLKVVDNLVYFTVNADTTIPNANSPAINNTTTTPYSIPVGIWMSVTPQISPSQQIILNIRPTIARQIGQGTQDPNPNIKIESRIPQIQVREMESILQVTDGNTVVLGGLMQEELVNKQVGVPGLMSLPWLGKLFQYQQQSMAKTELVILIKPVITNPNLVPNPNPVMRQDQQHSPLALGGYDE